MGEMNTAQLHYVEVMCESILHGMYCVLVVVVIWLLMQPRPVPRIQKVMFGAGIVMWMLSSVHLGLVIQQVTAVQTPLRNEQAHVETPLGNAQAQVSIATLQVLIGDMILLWRVWTVWGQNYWVTLIPFLLILAAAAIRFAVVASIAGVLKFSSDVSTAIIVANTLICTCLIAGRIWYLQWRMNKLLGHSLSKRSQHSYRGILMLIIESGLLYALMMILILILDYIHSVGVHAVLDMQIPTTGILPTLIVLAVHFDLVPGTNASEKYHAALTSQFQAASGYGTTDSSTIGGSKRTASVTLKADKARVATSSTDDDEIELNCNYNLKGNVSNASYSSYRDQGGMV